MAVWLIILLVVVLIFLFTKMSHLKYKIIIGLIIFLVLTFYLAINKNLSDEKISLFTIEGAETAVKTYFSWMGHVIKNLGSLTGNAAKVDWWHVSSNVTNTK
ncbi:MAG TPA: hypothetical protein VJA86_03615 [Candidatus Nanoarchaeia archaeon]|nr:hypothetical protein [Candidatus Nanoarchaeia archaeon]